MFWKMWIKLRKSNFVRGGYCTHVIDAQRGVTGLLQDILDSTRVGKPFPAQSRSQCSDLNIENVDCDLSVHDSIAVCHSAMFRWKH